MCYTEFMKTSNNTNNWPLVGNENISDFLMKSIIKRNIAGTYIFSGISDLGKTRAAKYFAQILLCEEADLSGGENMPCGKCRSCNKFSQVELKEETNLSDVHGDFYLLNADKDKKNITIEQVRDFIKRMGMGSFLGKNKVGIIKDADKLSKEAANALLKTLEEPKRNVIIILTVNNEDALLPTILSRGQLIKFHPVETAKIYDYLINKFKLERSAAKNIAHLSLGRPALAVKFLEDKKLYSYHLDIASKIISFFSLNIVERYQLLDELLNKTKTKGQEQLREIERVVSIWEGIIRDLMLLSLGEGDIIQYEAIQQNYKALLKTVNLTSLLNIFQELKQARILLKSNVSPKVVLENVAISF